MKDPFDPDNDFDFEPIPGLPGELPEGEKILWRGQPSWLPLTKRAFAIRWVIGYFALMVVFAAYALGIGEATVSQTLARMASMTLFGVVATGIFLLIGWLTAINAYYTITNKRVIVRHGLTMPTAINIPFEQVAAADLVTFPDGTGEVRLRLLDDARISLFALWPHSKPWEATQPQPALKGLADADSVARVLGAALTEALGATDATVAAQTKTRAYETLETEPRVIPGFAATSA